MKFGGTSVGSKEAMARTIEIVRGRLPERPVVVVSAMSKVTDMLYMVADFAKSGDKESQKAKVEELRLKHRSTAAELMADDAYWREEAFSRINSICDFIAASSDYVEIVSRGEYLSSNIMFCAMNALGVPTQYLDAREFMITDNERMQGAPQIAEIVSRTPKAVDTAFDTAAGGKLPKAVITQGFVSQTAFGVETILGRGGSDYTASLIGMAIDARRIEIWTDVDGIRSADPRKVDHTLCIGKISFEEAAEMARAGAKVLHPKTIEPAVTKNIPVMVLNSMNPDGEGTTILQSAFIEDGVKSVSSKENIAVVILRQRVMSNPSALLTACFGILSGAKVQTDIVTVSPTSVCFTTDSLKNLPAAVEQLREIAEVEVQEDKSQISVIGKNISELKAALRNSSELLSASSIVSLAQGDSYANISFVVDRKDAGEALRQIHTYLFG